MTPRTRYRMLRPIKTFVALSVIVAVGYFAVVALAEGSPIAPGQKIDGESLTFSVGIVVVVIGATGSAVWWLANDRASFRAAQRRLEAAQEAHGKHIADLYDKYDRLPKVMDEIRSMVAKVIESTH